MTVGKTDPQFQPALDAVGRALGSISGRDPATSQSVYPDSLDASLATLADQSGQAADGAAQIADGIRRAADGARQLRDGSTQLQDGLERIEAGMTRLRDGIRQMLEAVETAGPNVRRLEIGSRAVGERLGTIQGGTRSAGRRPVRRRRAERAARDRSRDGADRCGGLPAQADGARGSLNLLDRFKTLQTRSPNLFDSNT